MKGNGWERPRGLQIGKYVEIERHFCFFAFDKCMLSNPPTKINNNFKFFFPKVDFHFMRKSHTNIHNLNSKTKKEHRTRISR